MAVNGNFAVIPFGEHIGDNASDLNMPDVKFVGNQSTLKTFVIQGNPVGHSYLLLQTYDVEAYTHTIQINGVSLPGMTIPEHRGWEMWMVALPNNVLKSGTNTIQVLRDLSNEDDFIVGNIVVHWHEQVNW